MLDRDVLVARLATARCSGKPSLACAVSDAAQWKVSATAEAPRKQPDSMTATQSRWEFRAADMDALVTKTKPYDLEEVVVDIACPLLIVAGEFDSSGTESARNVFDTARAAGVDVTIK